MKQSWREHLNISRLAIKYSRVTIFVAIAVAVAGLLAFSSLKYALFPEITFPVVIVQASSPFDNTLETEQQVTEPLENALRSLPNAELFSSTYPGQSVVTVAFAAGLNVDQSTQMVEKSLKQTTLPPQITVEVTPFNINESVAVTYSILSPTQPFEILAEIAQEKIIPSLQALPGVRRVDLLGDGLFRDSSQGNIPNTNPPTLARFNQADVLAIQIVKQADANTLDIVAEVEKAIANLRQSLPDVQLIMAETQAKYIEEASHATIEALLGAIVLAVLVIFPFLGNFQATLITALAIPMSLLGTFIVMAIAGFNLETITLLGLALVIGIIVDDAIVDVENISRHIDEGMTPREAAIKGTDEVGLTVMASTFTLAAVFIPIAFIGGNLGHFFKPFGVTVAAAVLISLLVARTLSPVLAIYWMKGSKRKADQPKKTFFLARPYRRLLDWSLGHRKLVIGIALVSFIVGVGLIPFIPKGFVPKLDRGEFNIVYTLPTPQVPNRLRTANEAPKTEDSNNSLFSDLAQSPERFLLRKTRRVGEKLETIALENPNVESAYLVAGYHGNPLKGRIYIQLKGERTLSTSKIQDELRKKLPKLKGGSISVEDILFIETGDDSPLKVALLSDNLESLEKTANQLKARLETLPGLVDIKTSGDGNHSIVEHFQRQRVIYVTANLSEETGLGDITNKVIVITQDILPKDVTFDIQGASAQVRNIFKEFGIALSLAILCMMVILYVTFGRFLESFVVLLSLPLSLVGAMFALLITQSDFGMISLIGLIFLLGLLDKNAILLMDYTNQLRQKGMSRRQAILETGEVRLRPIIMTTASTILGMLPIAIGLGAGAELRQPMAVAIIGGLITSSLLSLIVVPVLYTLLEDGWEKLCFHRMRRVDN
ncbi:efflux RND transporter permease subunit [Crocosphaera sp. XPORK-15E]|uniref:efflux RND transporter permease subunit n=1 Tax=Crocosphaera sp. XPORK-15E TaxID=3110247 RepID=UPI002B208451|nr:efflux RND transporter permease subunit [Crocosphaera sp. XPORK-15E]MEA5535018.1 efflux RND transporter permease subunit [Crocosphaera sp. XPORK-15E]